MHTSDAMDFVAAGQGMPLEHVALAANEDYIHGFNRMAANRVLNWLSP